MFCVWYKSINADVKISNQQIEYLKDKYEFIECDRVDYADDHYLICKIKDIVIAIIPHERVLVILNEKEN